MLDEGAQKGEESFRADFRGPVEITASRSSWTIRRASAGSSASSGTRPTACSRIRGSRVREMVHGLVCVARRQLTALRVTRRPSAAGESRPRRARRRPRTRPRTRAGRRGRVLRSDAGQWRAPHHSALRGLAEGGVVAQPPRSGSASRSSLTCADPAETCRKRRDRGIVDGVGRWRRGRRRCRHPGRRREPRAGRPPAPRHLGRRHPTAQNAPRRVRRRRSSPGESPAAMLIGPSSPSASAASIHRPSRSNPFTVVTDTDRRKTREYVVFLISGGSRLCGSRSHLSSTALFSTSSTDFEGPPRLSDPCGRGHRPRTSRPLPR